MTTPTPERPRKVTMACLLAGVGAVLVLISVFVELSRWGSLEVREQVEGAITGGPLADAGLETDQVLDWLRWVLMATAAVAAATVVLAIWTFRRHRGARIGLTVLAAGSSVVFLAAGLSGIVPALMSLLCAFYLWSKESREWFAPPQTVPASTGSPAIEAPPSSPAGPPPTGTPPAAVPPAPGTTALMAPPAPPHRYHPMKRPPALVAAVIITVVMSAIVALGSLAVTVSYLSSPDEFADALADGLADQPIFGGSDVLDRIGMSAAELSQVLVGTMVVFAVLAVAAMVVALLALGRSPAWRVVLTVITGVAILCSILATLVGVVWIVAEVAVIVLLYRPEVNAWFRRQP